ncbi:probable serine/threonine-protein kinase At1g54610 [Abrus precatorius]|uniref:Probable serine/threonine-protein kinase At1g54610 n=1 Tax=Abrus precatorius TaxID=3816 RepID=A0A8B8JZM5_ABRPR|nr:probable serine/threonine-protein kinase At1g54610 [Abrus precatorius]
MAREIMILQKLDHPNVIKLEGLATSRMQYSLYLVFDFMQSDLTKIITRPGEKLTDPQIKCFMQQLLSGLQHCHERGVMHRDIKASNLLIDKRGVLKIADFGLANSIDAERPLTNRVVTLWYRAPELLLGSTDYGIGIDLWSVGCLLAEMFVGRPIMPGRTEVEQLHMIFKLFGAPSEDYFRKLKLTTSYRAPQPYKPIYQESFQKFPSSSNGLLTKLLDLDPANRGSAASALQSEFFKCSPLACDPSALPVINKEEDERSQTKRRRRHRVSKRGQPSQTRKSDASQSGKNQTTEQPGRDTESSKEKKNLEKLQKQSHDTGNSGSSTSLGSRMFMNASLSPVFLSSGTKSPKSDGHPNALKNIKNYSVLLQASMIDMINRNEGNEFAQLRRSFSTLDFRLDPHKLSNLYGSPKNI